MVAPCVCSRCGSSPGKGMDTSASPLESQPRHEQAATSPKFQDSGIFQRFCSPQKHRQGCPNLSMLSDGGVSQPSMRAVFGKACKHDRLSHRLTANPEDHQCIIIWTVRFSNKHDSESGTNPLNHFIRTHVPCLNLSLLKHMPVNSASAKLAHVPATKRLREQNANPCFATQLKLGTVTATTAI